jgi:hypothetical protein
MEMEITVEFLRAAVGCVSDPIRLALEEGLSKVPVVRSLLDAPPDPWFDAHVARRVARDRLEQAAPKFGEPWAVDRTVANSGIHLRVPAGKVRVMRGSVEQVPAPGHSLRRRNDWKQSAYVKLSLWPGDFEQLVSPQFKMLLLWNSRLSGELDLAVAVPDGVWKHGESPKLLAYAPLSDGMDEIVGEFAADEDSGTDLVVRFDQHDEDDGEADVG